MRSVATAVALGAAAAAAAAPSYGVCWTRNKVNHRPPKARKHETTEHLSSSELRNLVLSAASLKRRFPAVPTCLFTDLPPDLLERAIHGVRLKKGGEWTHNLKLFDVVRNDTRDAFVKTNLTGFERRWADAAGTLVNSRIGRIGNLQRSPFDVTLFLDDDTFFCLDVDVEADLRALSTLPSRVAVRAHPFDVHAKAPRLKQAHRCAWEATKRKRLGGNFSLVAAEVKCFDEHAPPTLWCSGAQGGALLVDRRGDVASFVEGWLATYVKLYKGFASSQAWKGRGHFGADQTALHDLFAASKLCDKGAATDLSFGYLPNALNERTRPKRADCARPRFARTRVLHHKNFVNEGTLAEAAARVDGFCEAANGGDGPTFVAAPAPAPVRLDCCDRGRVTCRRRAAARRLVHAPELYNRGTTRKKGLL